MKNIEERLNEMRQRSSDQQNKVDVAAAKEYFKKTIMPMLEAQKKAEQEGREPLT